MGKYTQCITYSMGKYNTLNSIHNIVELVIGMKRRFQKALPPPPPRPVPNNGFCRERYFEYLAFNEVVGSPIAADSSLTILVPPATPATLVSPKAPLGPGFAVREEEAAAMRMGWDMCCD